MHRVQNIGLQIVFNHIFQCNHIQADESASHRLCISGNMISVLTLVTITINYLLLDLESNICFLIIFASDQKSSHSQRFGSL